MIDIYILKSPPVELISCFINSNGMSTQNIQSSFLFLSTYVTWFQGEHRYKPKYSYKRSQIKIKRKCSQISDRYQYDLSMFSWLCHIWVQKMNSIRHSRRLSLNIIHTAVIPITQLNNEWTINNFYCSNDWTVGEPNFL